VGNVKQRGWFITEDATTENEVLCVEILLQLPTPTPNSISNSNEPPLVNFLLVFLCLSTYPAASKGFKVT